MKKINISLGTLALLGLASCQNGLEPLQQPGSTDTAVLSVQIDYPSNGGTRTTLTEEEGESLASLKCTWDEDDQVIVYNENGNKLGSLSVLSRSNDNRSAKFEGTLQGIEQGKHDYRFFYIPGDQDTAPFEYDYSKQSGNFEDFKKGDFLRATTEVNVAGSSAYAENMGLKRSVAYAHFSLNLPEGVTYNNEDITVVTGQGNKAELSGLNELTVTKGDIVVNKLDAYIALLPTEDAAGISFSVTIDGVDYKGGLEKAHSWQASEFINAGFEKGVAINVNLEKETRYKVTYKFMGECLNKETTGSRYIYQTMNDVEDTVVELTEASKFSYSVGTDDEGNDIDFGIGNMLNKDTYIADIKKGNESVSGKTVLLDKENTEVELTVYVAMNKYDLAIHVDLNYEGALEGSTATNCNNVLPKDLDTSDLDDPERTNYDFLGYSFDKNATEGNKNLEVAFTLDDRNSAVDVNGTKTITKTVYAIWKKKLIGAETGGEIPGSDW